VLAVGPLALVVVLLGPSPRGSPRRALRRRAVVVTIPQQEVTLAKPALPLQPTFAQITPELAESLAPMPVEGTRSMPPQVELPKATQPVQAQPQSPQMALPKPAPKPAKFVQPGPVRPVAAHPEHPQLRLVPPQAAQTQAHPQLRLVPPNAAQTQAQLRPVQVRPVQPEPEPSNPPTQLRPVQPKPEPAGVVAMSGLEQTTAPKLQQVQPVQPLFAQVETSRPMTAQLRQPGLVQPEPRQIETVVASKVVAPKVVLAKVAQPQMLQTAIAPKAAAAPTEVAAAQGVWAEPGRAATPWLRPAIATSSAAAETAPAARGAVPVGAVAAGAVAGSAEAAPAIATATLDTAKTAVAKVVLHHSSVRSGSASSLGAGCTLQVVCPDALSAALAQGSGSEDWCCEFHLAREFACYQGQTYRVLVLWAENEDNIRFAAGELLDIVKILGDVEQENKVDPSQANFIGKEKGEYVLRLMLFVADCEELIGQRGARIAQIRKDSGGKVFVENDVQDGCRMVRIVGSHAILQRALSKVLDVVFHLHLPSKKATSASASIPPVLAAASPDTHTIAFIAVPVAQSVCATGPTLASPPGALAAMPEISTQIRPEVGGEQRSSVQTAFIAKRVIAPKAGWATTLIQHGVHHPATHLASGVVPSGSDASNDSTGSFTPGMKPPGMLPRQVSAMSCEADAMPIPDQKALPMFRPKVRASDLAATPAASSERSAGCGSSRPDALSQLVATVGLFPSGSSEIQYEVSIVFSKGFAKALQFGSLVQFCADVMQVTGTTITFDADNPRCYIEGLVSQVYQAHFKLWLKSKQGQFTAHDKQPQEEPVQAQPKRVVPQRVRQEAHTLEYERVQMQPPRRVLPQEARTEAKSPEFHESWGRTVEEQPAKKFKPAQNSQSLENPLLGTSAAARAGTNAGTPASCHHSPCESSKPAPHGSRAGTPASFHDPGGSSSKPAVVPLGARAGTPASFHAFGGSSGSNTPAMVPIGARAGTSAFSSHTLGGSSYSSTQEAPPSGSWAKTLHPHMPSAATSVPLQALSTSRVRPAVIGAPAGAIGARSFSSSASVATAGLGGACGSGGLRPQQERERERDDRRQEEAAFGDTSAPSSARASAAVPRRVARSAPIGMLGSRVRREEVLSSSRPPPAAVGAPIGAKRPAPTPEPEPPQQPMRHAPEFEADPRADFVRECKDGGVSSTDASGTSSKAGPVDSFFQERKGGCMGAAASVSGPKAPDPLEDFFRDRPVGGPDGGSGGGRGDGRPGGPRGGVAIGAPSAGAKRPRAPEPAQGQDARRFNPLQPQQRPALGARAPAVVATPDDSLFGQDHDGRGEDEELDAAQTLRAIIARCQAQLEKVEARDKSEPSSNQ